MWSLNLLWKFTPLQSTYSIINLAIDAVSRARCRCAS